MRRAWKSTDCARLPGRKSSRGVPVHGVVVGSFVLLFSGTSLVLLALLDGLAAYVGGGESTIA